MTEPSSFFDLAQIAVALAGFSAIVIVLRRKDSGKWLRTDADQFHGMVLHAVAAGFFSMLPFALEVFVDRPVMLWKIASALLAIQLVLHIFGILQLPTTTWAAKIWVSIGLLPTALLVANVLGFVYDGSPLPYLVGVLWHLFQASTLFVFLIWIPKQNIEE